MKTVLVRETIRVVRNGAVGAGAPCVHSAAAEEGESFCHIYKIGAT